MIFAMVSTRRSVAYTELALPSFFASTELGPNDKIVLIVNDDGGMPDVDRMGIERSRFDVIAHETPQSFAANANFALRLASQARCGLIFLNNDIVFTPSWLAPLVECDDAITLPSCNQQYQYDDDGLRLAFVMGLDDFTGRQAALDAVAARHAARPVAGSWRRDILMSFFCVHIPYAVFSTIGDFDESFGPGGGEDIDYRIRALLAGFDVRYTTRSYVLHFMGKSTWRSGEPMAETTARDALYRRRFRQKWGDRLSLLLLAGQDPARVSRDLGVAEEVAQGDFPTAIRKLLPPESSGPAREDGAGARPSVCLSMIVKNEAPVIRRCLASVRPLISHWVVVDTGSTDGTQAIVRETLADLPGVLHERPWRDFAANRSEALTLARPNADYTLIIDADDVFDVPDNFEMPALDADSYTVDIRDTSIAYRRTQFVRNTLPWRYVGVLHEFIACDVAKTAGHLPLTMVRNHDGARRRDKETYRNDAALLESALGSEADPFLRARYTFYLAQSYRDCGEREKAVGSYLKRAGLGYWDQEIFVSLYEAAKLMTALGQPSEEILRTYQQATDACPSRIEAAHGAARLCRQAKAFARGFAIAMAARGRPEVQGGLFVEPWIYAYGLDDELSVLAYWSGHDRDSADAAERALASPLLPASERPRLEANRQFALDRMAKNSSRLQTAPAPAIGWAPTRPQGGTELMVEALRERLGPALDAIDLRVNLYDPQTRDARPLVVWFHHDIDQAAVQWCRDAALTGPVAAFVFISYWQRERYALTFGLPPERCVVIKYAMESAAEPRRWMPAPIYRCAYTSTPFRGLDILLDVWERLPVGRAELHVWSSMKLYTMDDGPYRHLMQRAQTMPGVIYHGLAPNAELRAALRDIHFLTYPNTFAETACLSVMEAMSAGVRVIVPSHGVLPETTGGYARVYPWSSDKATHAAVFADTLRQEFAEPWDGRPDEALDQQAHCRTIFSWERRLGEWRALIDDVSRGAPSSVETCSASARATTVDRYDDAAGLVPASHDGLHYLQFSAILSRKRGSRVYLEIGVQNGKHLAAVATGLAIGVDPAFNITANVAEHKTAVALHQMPSDRFFAEEGQALGLRQKPDLVFLDGLHVFEYLLRDFYNVEKLSDRGTLVMLHDCLPLNAEMADRDEQTAYRLGQNSRFPGYWTGDVWKVVAILLKYRPDLKIVCVDCPPTGLVCISGLDSRSTLLNDNYLSIVDEFRRVPNDLRSIGAMYREVEMVSSREIVKDFNHSLYFRM